MSETHQRRPMYDNNQQQQSTSIDIGAPSVGAIVWAAGKTRAQQAINLYANLDYLRPYFDVEPKEVLQRLLHSLIPRWPSRDENIKPELYGPSMIVFTLAAILIYQMKLSSHSVQDGTLIGASFLVCFGYWIGSSFAISSMSFVCNTRLTIIQILSLNGYALFSHCVVLFLATFIHTGHDHLLFYGLWFFVGGAAALKMASIIMSRTLNQRYQFLLATLIAAIHMFFLLYLHFAYHEFAETVAHALNNEATVATDLTVKPVPPLAAVQASLLASRSNVAARHIFRNLTVSTTATTIITKLATSAIKAAAAAAAKP